MSSQMFVFFYAAACGFVAAGILASFYQMITARAPQFQLEGSNLVLGISSALFCILAAPYIVMRNALRGRRIERRPLGWLVASSVISFMWSCCSGVIVIQVALAVGKVFV